MVKPPQTSDELNFQSTTSLDLTCRSFSSPISQSISNSRFPPSKMNQRFTKSERLLTPSDFQHVFSKAEKFGNRHWTFIVRPNGGHSARMGLAIAKKVLAKAVWRNRIKRLAREAFRTHKKALNGYDIVVLSRHGVQQVDNATLTQSFEHLVRLIQKKSSVKHSPTSRRKQPAERKLPRKPDVLP